jgi:tRNA(fMet)-specific endonuclease VapC
MIYILDTDVLSLLGHKDSPQAPRIRRRIVELPEEDSVVTSVINYEEQMRGWMAALSHARSQAAEIEVYGRLLLHLATYRRLTVLGYDSAAAAIVKRLRNQRVSVGAMDAKIAAIAISHNAVMITRKCG